MRATLASHDELAVAVLTDTGEVIFKHTGRGFAAVLASRSPAIRAAHEINRGPETFGGLTLRSRLGIHTGEATARDGDYLEDLPRYIS